MIGNTLSHYKIISKLGQGGQGEVYLAEDSRLDRKVALKILPEHLSERADLRERFEREARAVSSLNHPHICTLHDIGEQDGIHFLVMEHLEGETLAARLEKGALPLEQTLEYAIQIADALDKAHRQGVVHRDLKPGNIMLVKSGAKLLDFGLAKLKATEATEENLSNLPTEQANLTAEGTILGTLQYMAPEQLEGKDTDSRTDIFAFGAVVYEMATGKKAFEGSSQASLIVAIMGQEPRPMSELQPMTPQLLDWVVRRCLAKQPDERWQAASDVMAGLRQATEVGTTMDSLPAVAAPAVWKRAVPWSIVAVLAIITAVMSWSDSPVRSPGSTTPRRVTIDLAEGVTLPKGQGPAISISPDGQTRVYVGESGSGRQLYRRNMNQFASTPIPGTEGAFTPTISPDGDAVVFLSLSPKSIRGSRCPEASHSLCAALAMVLLGPMTDTSTSGVLTMDRFREFPNSGGQRSSSWSQCPIKDSVCCETLWFFPVAEPCWSKSANSGSLQGSRWSTSRARKSWRSPQMAPVRSIRPQDTFCFPAGTRCLRFLSTLTGWR